MSYSDEQIRREAESAARQMIREGYIAVSRDEKGEEIWTLTESGKDYLARLQEMEGGE
jgi:DNA-binding PadR family transcriptional regulator